MIGALVNLLILCAVFYVLYWAFTQIPGIPPAILVVLKVVGAVIFALCLLNMMGVVGPPGPWPTYQHRPGY